MKKMPEGEALEQRCRELGVDIEGDLIFASSSGRHSRASDYELQRRLIDVKRSIRESRLWVVAVISAIASALSAGAAWLAVLLK